MIEMVMEKEKKPAGDIEALPPEIRGYYEDVVKCHHKLLERLAQK